MTHGPLTPGTLFGGVVVSDNILVEIAALNALYVAGCFVLHFVLVAWCAKSIAAYSKWELRKQMEFVQALNALVTSVFVPLFYALGYYSLDFNVLDRWQGNNVMLVNALSLHAALTVYEIWLYVVFFPEKGIEFHAHHVFVLANCWLCLGTGRGGGWGAWFGVVEITNIPLTGITNLRQLKMQSHPLFGS